MSCSSLVPQSKDEASIELTQELNSLTQKAQQTNYGPTLKEGGSFLDKTAAYGLDGLEAVAFNAVDLNFDGFTDLIVLPTYYSRPKFFLMDAVQKKFILWKHDPLPADFKASFLIVHDFNKDQVPDIVASVLNQRSEISQVPVKVFYGAIRNGLLHFVEQKDALNLPAEPTSSVSAIDFDLDGWTDLFVGNWFENKKGQYFPVPDRLLRNNKGKFEEVTGLLKFEADKNSDQVYPPQAKPTYGSSTCDIDQNGFPDILTVSSSGHKNKLWMNLKETLSDDRFFEDVGSISNYASDPEGSLIPTGGGRSFFSACADYNNDGLMDIFLGELSHAYDNESVDRSSILTGSRESYPPFFIRTEYLSDSNSESWNQGDRRAVWLDYNLDGRLDLLVDNSGFPPFSRLVLFEQDETNAFSNVASQLGIDFVNPNGTIVMDLNHDGLPDLISAQNNIRRADISSRIYVFENQLKLNGRRSLRVHLNGVKANTKGLGSMIMLITLENGKQIIQRRWTEYSQGGLPSQSEEGMIFGLKEGVEVVGIKVRWPYLHKKGFSSGEALENFYSLKGVPFKNYLEITLCENGSFLAGKLSCQL